MQSTDISNWVKRVVQIPIRWQNLNPRTENRRGVRRGAVKIAVERHVGFISQYIRLWAGLFTYRKDLSAVPFVIGIGGAIINAENPKYILEGAKLQSDDFVYAKPKNPDYLIDKKYIFASMGLLSSDYPDLALELMKKEIKQPK